MRPRREKRFLKFNWLQNHRFITERENQPTKDSYDLCRYIQMDTLYQHGSGNQIITAVAKMRQLSLYRHNVVQTVNTVYNIM